MNSFIVIFVAGLALGTSNEIVQGPSVRTVNVGPDGSVIDSFATGGTVVSGPTTLLAAPSLRAYGSPAVSPYALPSPVVPSVASGRVYGAPLLAPPLGAPIFARSFYEPSFYTAGYPVPYGKAVISGPSGTIVADHQ